MNDDDDIDTRCDRCGNTARTGWIMPTGRIDPEFNAPIVELVCNDCHATEASMARHPSRG